MDRKHASKLLETQLSTIFAWSLAKSYDKSEADDLAQEIVCRICTVGTERD